MYRLALFLSVLTGLAVLSGCNGEGAAQSLNGTSQFTVTIHWPEVDSRLIPSLTKTVVVTLSNGAYTETKTATRALDFSRATTDITPESSTLLFLAVPSGHVTIHAAAYSASSYGAPSRQEVIPTPLAEGSYSFTCSPGQKLTVPITLTSTIASIAISGIEGNSLSLLVGQVMQLYVSAMTSDSKYVMTPSDAFIWAQTTGDGVASITANGYLTALAEGTATFMVTEQESKVSHTLTVTVTAPPNMAYSIPRQLSGIQGVNEWYYYAGKPDGTLTPLVWDNTVDPHGTLEYNTWNGTSPYLKITGRDAANWMLPGPGGYLHPGEGEDVTIGWRAPMDGAVKLSAMLQTVFPSPEATVMTADDGVKMSLYKNTTLISMPNFVFRGNPSISRMESVRTSTSGVSVVAGDMIYLYIDRGLWPDNDGMYYNFTIGYGTAIDTVPPVSTHRLSGDQLTISTTELGSGVAVIEYAADFTDDTWQPYSGPVTVPTGTHQILYRALDREGNVESYKQVTATIGEV